ncbi:hypothetical protein C0J52_13801 [Blattella germanica]|nr:hypothetical protein C0J52_13801 [Blattella germanica]
MLLMPPILVFLIIFCGKFVKGTLESNEEDWVDPFDMINYDRNTKSMKKNSRNTEEFADAVRQLKLCESKLASCETRNTSERSHQQHKIEDAPAVQSELLYMRRFVNILLRTSKLKTDGLPEDLDTTVRISVNLDQLGILQKFSKGSGRVSLQELDAVLSSVLLEPRKNVFSSENFSWTPVADLLRNKEMLLLLTLGLMPLVLFRLLKGHSFKKILMMFLLATFFLSYGVTYYRLYKKEEIRQFAAMKVNPDVPKECRSHAELTWRDKLFMLVSFSSRQNECQKYYEAVMMDPFVMITPTIVLSEMLSGFVLHPSGNLGHAIASFSSAILGNLPFGINYIVLLASFFMVIFLIIALCGGVIRLPFFLGSIEMGGRKQPHIETNKRNSSEDAQPAVQDDLSRLVSAIELKNAGLFITNVHGLRLLANGRLSLEGTLEESPRAKGTSSNKPCCSSSSDTKLLSEKEEIRQFAAMKVNPDVPKECRSHAELTWRDKLFMLVSFSSRQNECQKYYEAVMMDPFVMITPTIVLSEMLSGFVLHPSGNLGHAIASFSSAILGKSPFSFCSPLLMM